jgi:hypothetical protein
MEWATYEIEAAPVSGPPPLVLKIADGAEALDDLENVGA